MLDVMDIPFVSTVGLVRREDGLLMLPYSGAVHNHLQTVHAAAQFSLAESASGDALLKLFPDLVDEVIPVLRDSQLKFRRPASSHLVGYPEVVDEEVAAFLERLERKGRSSLSIPVKVRDADDEVTCKGVFNWFVQHVSVLEDS